MLYVGYVVSFLKPNFPHINHFPVLPSRLLGCFSDTKKLGPTGVFPSNAQPFQRLLEDEAATGGCAGDSVCPTLKHCSKLFIYLYKMATDSFDRSVDCSKSEFRPLILIVILTHVAQCEIKWKSNVPNVSQFVFNLALPYNQMPTCNHLQ